MAELNVPRWNYPNENVLPPWGAAPQWNWPTTNPWGAGNPWAGNQQNPFDIWNNASWMNEESRGAMKSWLENWAFPSAQQQLNQNIAQRDWQLGLMDRQANWQQSMFNQALAQQQYNMQALAMEQENKQFYDQFEQNRWAKENEFNIARQQNQIDQAYKQGLISNQEYQAQTERLAQQSNQQKWQQELATQQQQFEKTFGLQQQQQKWQQGFSQQELAAKQEQARLDAFGRRQAPNSKWAATWR